jgi:hypothetical protein
LNLLAGSSMRVIDDSQENIKAMNEEADDDDEDDKHLFLMGSDSGEAALSLPDVFMSVE